MRVGERKGGREAKGGEGESDGRFPRLFWFSSPHRDARIVTADTVSLLVEVIRSNYLVLSWASQ